MFQSRFSLTIVGLLALNCAISACGGSSKKSGADPVAPTPDTTLEPGEEDNKTTLEPVQDDSKKSEEGAGEKSEPAPPEELSNIPIYWVGSWQSKLADEKHAGSITYTLDKDGRLQVSLMVYSRSQRKLLAERQEWKGGFKNGYVGQLVKSSCAPAESGLTLKMAANNTWDVLRLGDEGDESLAYIELDKAKGLNEDVHSATEIHGLPVVEGCFTEGRLSGFVPNSAQEEVVKAPEPAIPVVGSYRSLKDLCLDAIEDQGSSLDKTIRAFMVKVFKSSVWKDQVYSAGECETLSKDAAKIDILQLNGNEFKGISVFDGRVLIGFSKLTDLQLPAGRWTHMEVLTELKYLNELNFLGSTFDDLSFIQRLPKLKSLIYSKAPITKLADLSNPLMEHLSVFGKSLKAVGTDGDKFPALKSLYLAGQPLEDLNGIETFKNLAELSIINTRVHDLTPLSKLIQVNVYAEGVVGFETCPIFLGYCDLGKTFIYGSGIGVEMVGEQSFYLQSTFSKQRILPAIGKIPTE